MVKDKYPHIKDIQYKGHEKSNRISQGGSLNNELKTIKDRKAKVILVLKSKKLATIGEISEDFKGVSEKTIQRLLQSLVDEGVVLRTGKRRWSKYSAK